MASNANFVWQRASNLILHWRNIFAISIWKKCRLLVIFAMSDLLMKMFWNVTRKFIIYFTNYILHLRLEWKNSVFFKTSTWEKYVFGWMSHSIHVISLSPQAKWYVLIWINYWIPLTCLEYNIEKWPSTYKDRVLYSL